MSAEQSPLDFRKLPDLRKESGTDDPEELYFLQSIEAREAALKSIFGQTDPPDQLMSPRDPQLVLNWPGGGVLRFPPRNGRAAWHFVTHGLSQPSRIYPPDLDHCLAECRSGIGFELVISTREECVWPTAVLFNLVRYLLFSPTAHAILPGHRLPCNGPLALGADTKLTHLLARTCDKYSNHIWLPAGNCKLVHLVGITEGELAAVKELMPGLAGSFVLNKLLDETGIGFESLPERACLASRADFAELLEKSALL